MPYARPYWRSYALVLLLAVLVSVVTVLLPWPMKLVVDHLLSQSPLPPMVAAVFDWIEPDPSRLLILSLLVLAGLALVGLNLACESAMAWLWTRSGRRMVYALTSDVFEQLQQRSLRFHVRNSTGDLMTRVTTDTWSLYHLLDTMLIAPIQALLTLGFMMVFMSQLSGWLTWLALAMLPFMMGAGFVAGRPLRAVARLRREIESRLTAHVQQTLLGLPVVQAFAQEEREQARFTELADAAVRIQQRGTFLDSLNSLSSGLTATLGAGLIIWFGARMVTQDTLPLGSLLVLLAYLATLQAQMKTFASLHAALQGLRPSADRVIEILDTPSDIADSADATPLPPVRGGVRFEQVTFGYHPDRPALREVTFEVRPGETIAIVGPTGAGKSTLVSLLPRFIDPCQGRVLVDGHDLRQAQLQTLRRQVAVVFQETFLFSGTVAENIGCGRPGASRSDVEAAARAAGAHDFIARLPQGYDTPIGERGTALSGGERQRLAIARALLRNAPILILDEPTSALDAGTEHSLLEALEQLVSGRTTFIVAHRLSTIRRADRILVLAEGRLAESGTHEELLAADGLYAHLWRSSASGPREEGRP